MRFNEYVKDPDRWCPSCGKLLVRKRHVSRLECRGHFLTRRFCDNACRGAFQRRIGKAERTRDDGAIRCRGCEQFLPLSAYYRLTPGTPKKLPIYCLECQDKRWIETAAVIVPGKRPAVTERICTECLLRKPIAEFEATETNWRRTCKSCWVLGETPPVTPDTLEQLYPYIAEPAPIVEIIAYARALADSGIPTFLEDIARTIPHDGDGLARPRFKNPVKVKMWNDMIRERLGRSYEAVSA